jgi:hypothetical protein
MNWKGYEIRLSWTNLRHYHDILMEVLRKITKDSQDNKSRPIFESETSRVRCRIANHLAVTLYETHTQS